MGVKYTFRYMDDVVVLHKDKQYLHNLKRRMDKYLNNNLDLTIKENWQVFPVDDRGIDFLGYKIFRNYVLLRKSTAKNLKKKMKRLQNYERLTFSQHCSVQSYKGWIKWCNSYNLYKKYIKPLEGRDVIK